MAIRVGDDHDDDDDDARAAHTGLDIVVWFGPSMQADMMSCPSTEIAKPLFTIDIPFGRAKLLVTRWNTIYWYWPILPLTAIKRPCQTIDQTLDPTLEPSRPLDQIQNHPVGHNDYSREAVPCYRYRE